MKILEKWYKSMSPCSSTCLSCSTSPHKSTCLPSPESPHPPPCLSAYRSLRDRTPPSSTSPRSSALPGPACPHSHLRVRTREHASRALRARILLRACCVLRGHTVPPASGESFVRQCRQALHCVLGAQSALDLCQWSVGVCFRMWYTSPRTPHTVFEDSRSDGARLQPRHDIQATSLFGRGDLRHPHRQVCN